MTGFIIAVFLYYFFCQKIKLLITLLIIVISFLSIYLAFIKSVRSFNDYVLAKNRVDTFSFYNINAQIIRSKQFAFQYEYLFWLDQFKTYALFQSKEVIKNKALIINGKLAPLGNDPNFDYYYIQNILFRITDLKIERYKTIKNGNYPNLIFLRHKFANSVDFYISYPQNEFLKSILLNERDNFPKYLRNIFKETNTYHIFAISGQHISIFMIIFVHFLSILGLRKRHSLILSSIFIILYVLLVGAPIPALRALLFNLLAIIGFFGSWKIDFRKLLLYIAVLFLFFKPILIKYDLSFIFSFVASLSLIVFSEPLLYFIYLANQKFKLPRFILDPLVSTIAASILIAPLNFYFWHSFNLLGILINIFVLIFIPWILFLAIMIIGIWWSHHLMIIWSFVLEKLVLLVIWLVQTFHKIDVLKFKFSATFWQVIVYYLLTALLLYKWSLYKKRLTQKSATYVADLF